MSTLRSPLFVAAVVVIALGCGDPSRPAGADGAVDDSAVRLDSGRPTDGGGDATRPPGDSGFSTDSGGDGGIIGAAPPPGTTRCGMGTVSDEELRTACSTLDPVVDLGTGGMAECDAFVTGGVDYEVWCSTDTVYVWIYASRLDDPSKQSCTGTVTAPDGMVYTYTNRVFRWEGYDATGQNPVLLIGSGGERFTDGVGGMPLWISGGISDGEERPWTVSYEQTESGLLFDATAGGSGLVAMRLGQVDCDGIPISDSQRYVLVVPLRW